MAPLVGAVKRRAAGNRFRRRLYRRAACDIEPATAAEAQALFGHMRFDDRLALRRKLVKVLAQARHHPTAAGLDARTVFLEVGQASLALSSRLRHCRGSGPSKRQADRRKKDPHDNLPHQASNIFRMSR